MTFRPELLNELLKSYRNPKDLLGEGSILKQRTLADLISLENQIP